MISCIVGGVRKARSKQANVFHPVNIIDLVIYESEEKLSRIKESGLAAQYHKINFDVAVSAVAMFIIDLSRNAIRESESNPSMYAFLRSSLLLLDSGSQNLRFFPHRFALQLTALLGFEPMDNYSDVNRYFDVLEGDFKDNDVRHQHILDESLSYSMHLLLQDGNVENMTKTDRAELLDALLDFYKLHLEGFRELKCLPVLRSVLS